MEIKRIFDLLPYYADNHPPKPDVLAGKECGQWYKYTIEEYIESANLISYGLLRLGISRGDTVATICNNRPEWNLLDMGIMQIGAVHVPIYPTISDADYEYILNHAEVKVIFVAGDDLYKRLERILPNSCCIAHVFTIREMPGKPSLNDLMQSGRENRIPEALEFMKSEISTDDLATLIYTSGTTGNPKGVMLSHKNLISNMMDVVHIPGLGPEARALSFLPLSHVYERILVYLYQYLGISIYYVESMATIVDNIKEVQPDIFSAVPRFLEKVLDKILATGRKLPGIQKSIFFWAVNLGYHFELNGSKGWWYHTQLMIADNLVFSKWRAALGGNTKLIVSGGAALPQRIARLFWAARLNIHEGYGLTETSPVISVGTRDKNGISFGTVGPILKSVTVLLAGDQEILVKGPNVMMGYYKDESLTKEVIDQNGWFHTGDLGIIEKDGHLRIVGRKKEIFKTSMGKYISPESVENKMKESPFVDQIIVVGENQKYAAALIVPDFEYLRSYCDIKNIEYVSDKVIIRNPQIRKRYIREIDKFNKELGSTEQVKKFELLDTEWGIPSGELTPSLKLKRNFITRKYDTLIAGLFE